MIESENKEYIDIKSYDDYFVLLDNSYCISYYGYINKDVNKSEQDMQLKLIDFDYENEEINNFICCNNYICILSNKLNIFLYNEFGLYKVKIQDSINKIYQMKNNIFLFSYDNRTIHVLENSNINNNIKNNLIGKSYKINDKLSLIGIFENNYSNPEEILFKIKGDFVLKYENNENIFNLLYSFNYNEENEFNQSSSDSIYPVNISLSKINVIPRINKISNLLRKVFDSKINEIKRKRAKSSNRIIMLEKIKLNVNKMKKSKSNNSFTFNKNIDNLFIKENFISESNESINLITFIFDKIDNKLKIPKEENKRILDIKTIIQLQLNNFKIITTKKNNKIEQQSRERKRKENQNIKNQDSETFYSKLFQNSTLFSSQNSSIPKKDNNHFYNIGNYNKFYKRRNNIENISFNKSNSLINNYISKKKKINDNSSQIKKNKREIRQNKMKGINNSMILGINLKSKKKLYDKSKSVLYSPKKNLKNFLGTDNKLNKRKLVKSKSTIKILNYNNLEIINSNKKNRHITPLNFISKKNISIIPLNADNKQKQILNYQNEIGIDKLKEKYMNYLYKKLDFQISNKIDIQNFINTEMDNKDKIYNLLKKNIYLSEKEINQYIYEILKFKNTKNKLREIDNNLISDTINQNNLITFEEEENEKNSSLEPIELE